MSVNWLYRLPRPDPRTVALVVAIVVALGLVGGGVWYWWAAAESRASSAYAAALTRVSAAAGPKATPEARLAREDLLVEIEAIAVLPE